MYATSLCFVNSLNFVDSSGQLDFNFDIKPDICGYNKSGTRRGPTDTSSVEFIIEFKWHTGNDPFCNPYTTEGGKSSFLRSSNSATDTAGQITAYTAAQLGAQFRTCVYSILIVASYARLIRWDRSGAIVSEPI